MKLIVAGVHSAVRVDFHLRRHRGYFLLHLYLPCSLVTLLSWVSFWLNREATADRIGLGTRLFSKVLIPVLPSRNRNFWKNTNHPDLEKGSWPPLVGLRRCSKIEDVTQKYITRQVTAFSLRTRERKASCEAMWWRFPFIFCLSWIIMQRLLDQ